MELPRLAILGGDTCFEVQGDGVRDYACRFGGALQETGRFDVDLFWRRTTGSWGCAHGDTTKYGGETSDPWRLLPGYAAVILQYDMFRFDRRGFAPWLPYRLARLRRAAPGTRIAVMMHELHSPFLGWKWRLKYGWQRVQQFAMRLSTDVFFCAVEPWTEELARKRPARPALHLPVASNLPDRRHAREWERLRLGADRGTIVIAAFGTDASAWRLLDYLVHAVNTVAQSGRKLVFLNLGGNTPKLSGIRDDVHVYQPGFLPAEAIAEAIAATDIFLAPFADGVSARRTTLMAAMQHGVAIVGTDGVYTDRLLREAHHALRLAPMADPDAFARQVLRLATNPDERLALGRGARTLYEEQFDWPVIAARVATTLGRGELDPSSRAREVPAS